LRRRLSPGLPNFNPQYVTIFVSNQQILSRKFRIMKHRKYSGKSVAMVVGLQALQTDYVCQAKTENSPNPYEYAAFNCANALHLMLYQGIRRPLSDHTFT
jgi:hypothetical protein